MGKLKTQAAAFFPNLADVMLCQRQQAVYSVAQGSEPPSGYLFSDKCFWIASRSSTSIVYWAHTLWLFSPTQGTDPKPISKNFEE